MKKIIATLLLTSLTQAATAATDNPYYQRAHDMLRDTVEIRTADGQGLTKQAQEVLAHYFLKAGFSESEISITSYDDNHYSLAAVLKGQNPSLKPILLMSHMDVVDALPEDWTLPPFELTEMGESLYGRGTIDNKAGVVTAANALMRLKEEGYVPEQDIIFIATGDEETSGQSMLWLLESRSDIANAALALNTDAGGGGISESGVPYFTIQTSEKMYLSFQLTIRDEGGHSSVPKRNDNPIYDLSRALLNIEAYEFPLSLNENSRAVFDGLSKLDDSDINKAAAALANDTATSAQINAITSVDFLNAMLRTTCVATRLFGGHADNALPQLAQATVNCRIIPGVSGDDVQETLTSLIDNDNIEITKLDVARPSDPSPLRSDIFNFTAEFFKNLHGDHLVVMPSMSTGATDGLFTRNVGIPTYGVSGIFTKEGDANAHGQNERINTLYFYQSQDYWYEMLKTITVD